MLVGKLDPAEDEPNEFPAKFGAVGLPVGRVMIWPELEELWGMEFLEL